MDDSKLHSGVRRSRETEATSSGSCSGKRRRFNPRDQENVVQLENQCRSEVDVNFTEDIISTADSGCCDHVLSSQSFKNDLSLDLKAELRCVTETSKSSNDGFSGETSSSSEVCVNSEEMESQSTLKKQPPATPSRRHPVKVSNLPSAAEIDEFFAVAEKKEQKRFANKYNFDFVNDVPMEGRYQWVRLKP